MRLACIRSGLLYNERKDAICGGDIQGRLFRNTGLVLQEFANDIAIDLTLKCT
jgi:hypothetical protein